MVYPVPPALPGVVYDEASEEVFFESADGTKLEGRYYPSVGSQRVILYCQANGEDIAHNDPYLSFLRDALSASVFSVNYRGYGRSDGRPHERGVIEDGLAAQRWVAEREDLELDEIVVYGRSLGGGVAVAVAAQQGARALVLHGTFSSLPDVAARFFGWLPVRWLMRNRFPSVNRIQNYQGPLIQFHGTDDEVIPFALGRQLFEAAASEDKEFIEVVGGTHNEPLPEECYLKMREFLDGLE